MIKTSQKAKWPTILLIIAGVLFVFGAALHPDETIEGALAGPLWTLSHIVFTIIFFLIIFGIYAFYQEYENLNAFDIITLKLLKISSVFLVGLAFFVEALIVPALANSNYAEVLSETGILFGGTFGLVLMLILALVAISFILFGIFVIYKKVSNPVAGILLFGGALLAFTPPLPYIIGMIGGVACGLGLLWVGISLFRKV